MQKGFKKLKLKIGRDRKRMAKTTGESNIQNQRAEKGFQIHNQNLKC